MKRNGCEEPCKEGNEKNGVRNRASAAIWLQQSSTKAYSKSLEKLDASKLKRAGGSALEARPKNPVIGSSRSSSLSSSSFFLASSNQKPTSTELANGANLRISGFAAMVLRGRLIASSVKASFACLPFTCRTRTSISFESGSIQYLISFPRGYSALECFNESTEAFKIALGFGWPLAVETVMLRRF